MSTLAAAEDDVLVQAARNGCPDAFATLYARHRARVAGVCARRVARADVDDVVQEAFVRAWQALDALEEAARFGPWVRTIAVRTAVDHLRSARARGPAAVNPIAELFVDGEVDELVDQLDRRAEAARVVSHLPSLQPRDGQALWLRDALGAPIPDVAAELGLTEGSTRVLLARARKRLRTAAGAVAVWIAALVAGRRAALGSGSAPVPVAAVLGVAAVVGVTGPAPRPTPPRVVPVAPSAADDDGPPPPAARPAIAPVAPARPDPGGPDRMSRADVVVADAADPSTPTPAVDPVVDPRIERRPVTEDDPKRDLTVGSEDDPARVGVYDGGELDVLPIDVADDGRVVLDPAPVDHLLRR